jgi:hypothetical protein
VAFPIERYQHSGSSQEEEEEEEEEDALEPELRTVRQRLVPQKKDHRPRKRAFESTPKKALATAPATTTTTAALPFVFGAPPALSPTAPGGTGSLFGVFDSSKMAIKFTGGSENETVEQEQEQEEEESKEGDDVDEGTSDKKPHKGTQAVHELPVPELEKQIKVCVVCGRVSYVCRLLTLEWWSRR